MTETPPRLRRSTAGLGFAVGQVPGAAVYTGPERDADVQQRVWVYNEAELQTSQEVVCPVPASFSMWVDVDGVHDVPLVKEIGETFGLHPLVVEDIVALGQRVRVERHEDLLVYTVRMLVPGAKDPEQITLIQAQDYVITFQEEPGDNFDPVRGRLSRGLGRVRSANAAYLAYALLDAVVDGYAVFQKAIEEKITELETEIDDADNPDETVPARIHSLKRRLLELRAAATPLRDEIGRLIRDKHPLLDADALPFFRDLHDHLFQVVDAIESTRETARGLLELHLSSVSQKMNEDMRVLTVVATIFIPLTFLAGIYGMNFENIPELKLPWAYPVFWAVTILIAGGLGLYFRRRRWL